MRSGVCKFFSGEIFLRCRDHFSELLPISIDSSSWSPADKGTAAKSRDLPDQAAKDIFGEAQTFADLMPISRYRGACTC